MDGFIQKGFYTIGALKTNRIIYSCGIRQKVSGFALHLRKADADVSLVTVVERKFMCIGMMENSMTFQMRQ